MSLAPDIASSISRTEASRATANGMNELGNRTVSRSGRIGNSPGIERAGRSLGASRSSRSSLIGGRSPSFGQSVHSYDAPEGGRHEAITKKNAQLPDSS